MKDKGILCLLIYGVTLIHMVSLALFNLCVFFINQNSLVVIPRSLNKQHGMKMRNTPPARFVLTFFILKGQCSRGNTLLIDYEMYDSLEFSYIALSFSLPISTTPACYLGKIILAVSRRSKLGLVSTTPTKKSLLYIVFSFYRNSGISPASVS